MSGPTKSVSLVIMKVVAGQCMQCVLAACSLEFIIQVPLATFPYIGECAHMTAASVS